jgi:3-hydroxyisobutyrate dehydrogenase-like beta-hydroxyacid dehydrogenase
VLASFTRAQYHLGPVGAGSQAKLVVNLVVGVSRAALGEAMVLAERTGLDLGTMLQVLGDSVAASRVLEVYGPRMASADHEEPTSRLASHAKTIGLILDLGREHDAALWFTEVAARLLRIAQADGMNELDSTATIAVFRKLAGAGPVRR